MGNEYEMFSSLTCGSEQWLLPLSKRNFYKGLGLPHLVFCSCINTYPHGGVEGHVE